VIQTPARNRSASWVRTIRHGAAPGGWPLMIMPTEDYNRFTDDDLASELRALHLFLKSLPAHPQG
jgi:hypothetical protein